MSRYANKRRLLIAATAATGLTVAAGIGVPMAMADSAANESSSLKSTGAMQCEAPDEHDTKVAATMYDVADERGVDDKVLLATFETGWVTSHVNNLDCGEESLGVFQVTPGSQWCATAEECLDVTVVGNKFLDLAEVANEENPDATAGELAALVMHSAYPDRYEAAEPTARDIIDEASQA